MKVAAQTSRGELLTGKLHGRLLLSTAKLIGALPFTILQQCSRALSGPDCCKRVTIKCRVHRCSCIGQDWRMRLVEKASYARRTEHDAQSVDLQVAGANHVAQSLYCSLGFEPVYGYHYRTRALSS